MSRIEFFKKVIRYILLTLLAGVTLFLGSRAAINNDCSSCPGKGICSGKSDCSTYLPE